MLLPAVQIIGSQSRGPVEASPDVIREGKTKPAAKKLPLESGCSGQAGPGRFRFSSKRRESTRNWAAMLICNFSEIDKITSRGEIRVVKGRFRTYGVNLEIVRGRLFYAGGPINQPSLDILA